jgi:hypothetical protein
MPSRLYQSDRRFQTPPTSARIKAHIRSLCIFTPSSGFQWKGGIRSPNLTQPCLILRMPCIHEVLGEKLVATPNWGRRLDHATGTPGGGAVNGANSVAAMAHEPRYPARRG